MAKPTVTVSLNEDDFYFLMGCVACSVPSDDEKNTDELKTVRKMRRASDRLALKDTQK